MSDAISQEIPTRAQRLLSLAVEKVSEVQEKKDSKLEGCYRNLCQSFPVFVRTCGLAQAVAFSASKAEDNSSKPIPYAHHLLLQHMRAVLEMRAGRNEDIIEAIRTADTMRYMEMTRQILDAAIYFKRFSMALLKEDC